MHQKLLDAKLDVLTPYTFSLSISVDLSTISLFTISLLLALLLLQQQHMMINIMMATKAEPTDMRTIAHTGNGFEISVM